MGNHLSNLCSGTCTCIFPESEELKETHIIQLAEKYPIFQRYIRRYRQSYQYIIS